MQLAKAEEAQKKTARFRTPFSDSQEVKIRTG